MAHWEFPFIGETSVLDDWVRASVAGDFVKLPDGYTHYEMAGPPDGQVIILVHGFSVPYFLWNPTFKALSESGFRVLRYDLFGRGYSDRPFAVYNADLFDRQLLQLGSALSLARPFDLVGLSMGGSIAMVFTERHPELVRRLCLISPAGYEVSFPTSARLLNIPLLGEILFSLFAEQVIIASQPKDFFHPERFPDYTDRVRPQMKYKGYRRALLSTLRDGPLEGLSDSYLRVGQQGRPILLLWGQQDQTVPFSSNEKVRQALPRAEFHMIEEAGHVSQYEQPEIVNGRLVEFLKR
jgi:pimeloyl-ACP methyl ester carboxylesterase